VVVKVLIAGCGYVGCALGAELLAQGDEVWGLRRDPSQLPAGFSQIAADLASPADLQRLPASLDAVVYCAGADESTDAAYQRAYVTGLSHLLHALERREVQRVVFTSSTAVYAQGDGQWLDETSETAPTYFSGVRLLEAEHLLQEHHLPSTILRCSGIYGPGRTRLIESVRQGTARATARHANRIHRDDVAGAIRHLLSMNAAPELLLLTDDEPAPERDVLGYVAKLLGVPEPLAATSPASSRPGDKRCSNARLRATGYTLRFPTYREGYAALLDGTVAR
jgi:nucleoside-diphosphate-sugar epimerase